MPDDADPPLSMATADQLLDEVHRRFPDMVFAGDGGRDDDGDPEWRLLFYGETDKKVGMATRLLTAVRMKQRRELRGAKWNEEPEKE